MMHGASAIDWWGFAAAVLLIELTPGPNMAWLAGLTLSEGRRAGLAAVAGIGLGLLLNGLLAAWGLAELIAANHWIEHWLRYAAAALLLVLAWRAWHQADETPEPETARQGFAAGLMLNLLNPKALLFFIVVVPAFVSGGALTLGQAVALAMLSVALATTVHLVIVFGAAHAHAWVSNPARTRRVRRTMAVAMIGVAVWFAIG